MSAGRPTSAAAAWMSATASPSATPGARLNEIDDRRQLGDVVDGERRRLVDALGHRVERHQAAGGRAHLHACAAPRWCRHTSGRPRGSPGRCRRRRRWSRPGASRRPSRAAGGSGRPRGRAARRCRGRSRSRAERARTCRSELTSMMVGMRRIRSSISGAKSRSAARSLERMPNWYWARVCVVPMLIDCTGWKKMLMPGTVAAARRRRAITCRALSLRSGLSRSMMNMRPELTVLAPRCRRRPSTSPRRRRDRA